MEYNNAGLKPLYGKGEGVITAIDLLGNNVKISMLRRPVESQGCCCKARGRFSHALRIAGPEVGLLAIPAWRELMLVP